MTIRTSPEEIEKMQARVEIAVKTASRFGAFDRNYENPKYAKYRTECFEAQRDLKLAQVLNYDCDWIESHK